MSRLLFLSFPLLVFAGCLEGADRGTLDGARDLHLLPTGCDARLHCRETERGGRPLWVLENQDAWADSSSGLPYSPAAATVHLGLADVLIRNVTLHSGHVGLRIHAAWPEMCVACHLSLENVTIQGTRGAETGIQFIAPPGATSSLQISLENVRIEGYAAAILVGLDTAPTAGQPLSLRIDTVRVACEDFGVAVDAYVLEVERLEVDGCRNVGLLASAYGPATIEQSSFTRCFTGVQVHARDGPVLVADSLIEGNQQGLVATGLHFAAERLQVERNWGFGMHLDNGTVTDSNFEGNVRGLRATLPTQVRATHNYWNDPMGPRLSVLGVIVGPGGDPVDAGIEFYPFRSEPVATPLPAFPFQESPIWLNVVHQGPRAILQGWLGHPVTERLHFPIQS